MITLRQVSIYQRYGGDEDQLARVGSAEEKAAFPDGDWGLIKSLLQDIYLVENQLASEQFEADLLAKIKANCEDAAVIEQLYQIAQNNIGCERSRTLKILQFGSRSSLSSKSVNNQA